MGAFINHHSNTTLYPYEASDQKTTHLSRRQNKRFQNHYPAYDDNNFSKPTTCNAEWELMKISIFLIWRALPPSSSKLHVGLLRGEMKGGKKMKYCCVSSLPIVLEGLSCPLLGSRSTVAGSGCVKYCNIRLFAQYCLSGGFSGDSEYQRRQDMQRGVQGGSKLGHHSQNPRERDL